MYIKDESYFRNLEFDFEYDIFKPAIKKYVAVNLGNNTISHNEISATRVELINYLEGILILREMNINLVSSVIDKWLTKHVFIKIDNATPDGLIKFKSSAKKALEDMLSNQKKTKDDLCEEFDFSIDEKDDSETIGIDPSKKSEFDLVLDKVLYDFFKGANIIAQSIVELTNTLLAEAKNNKQEKP